MRRSGWSKSRLFFFSSRRRHTRCGRDWSSDVCSSDLNLASRTPQPLPDAVPVAAPPYGNFLQHGDGKNGRVRAAAPTLEQVSTCERSEERRVGKERRSRRSPYQEKHNLRTIIVTDVA